MKTLTAAELTTNLTSMDRTVLATVRTATEPAMRKTGNPFYGKVVKVQDLSLLVEKKFALKKEFLKHN